ncbi:ISNCY-like element ISFac3 family transposase [Ferroplasma acidarmanus]|jgi:transposase|uniref:Transposase n=1 Tax=Ferroplasma acidarmanus Fer1 TaxID=333146 RepID=S0AR08_FERAC|nr:ISNCY-like element ISFac3 family transposase [Ferroplasma acidarmanus]AGO60105.1 transposase [Ferroplasma acidarmanus Fer1]AGO60707.1 transposase [Ferroplasma acidarmanus Fer1]AGO61096.1 transposase [Ferroplasma acidarmanus Fer1]AGO61202.1 transposase [Ferroplasma acidarmanus Fer1]AGO61214.1 transposase [Ferroplasma acidarmanus Fer1]
MGLVRSEDIQYKLEEINNILGKKYVQEHPEKGRNWRTYESEFSRRIKTAMKELDPLIEKAVSIMHIAKRPGHPHSLLLAQRVKLILIKQLVGESNRMFVNMLDIFSMLSGIDVSYKTIERLYSDNEVVMAIFNLHVLLLKNKNIANSDATGDGTGYSLTVKKNYESYAQRLKDLAKENKEIGKEEHKDKKSKGHRKRLFAYSFSIMDLRTRMYIASGTSMKSERNAYDNAMRIVNKIGINIDSIRLDRYYSSPSYVDKLGDTKVYIIPKKNSTLHGSHKWKSIIREFLNDTMNYLEKYHKRSNSESGFAADKKMLGWNMAQRRDDRIGNALLCTNVWHNLFNMGRY